MKEHISHQAHAVLDTLSAERCHLTAEEVLSQLPDISSATVYRSLDHLTALGFIRRLALRDRTAVYELSRAPHSHFVCDRCDRIFDIPVDITGMVSEAAGCYGHIVNRSDTIAHGLCCHCAPSSASEHEI